MEDEDREAEQTRVVDLSKRIAEFEIRQQEERQHRKTQLPTGGMALAGRVTTELVAGVVVGTFIGWALDKWLGTTPTLMVVFFFYWLCRRHDECVAGPNRTRHGSWVR